MATNMAMVMGASHRPKPSRVMRRRSYRSRWSRREWAWRGLAAILVAIIAGFSLSFSIAQTLSKSSAARAYRLAPYDGRITALLAASLAAADASVSDRRRSDMLAREALDRDPTAIAALSTLGINAQVRGDMAGARRLFTYAEHLSRRDPQTQLWAIENAVSRGAVAEALSKYDIALRTSPRLAPLLYPVLTEASIDPRIRIELVRTFASKPGWSGNFLEFASSKSTDPGSLALLFVALRRAGMSIPNSANSNLIAKLMMGGMAERAWNYYAILRPGVDRRRSRDSRFDYDNDVPSVLDWMLVNDEGAASSIQRGDSGGVFVFSVVVEWRRAGAAADAAVTSWRISIGWAQYGRRIEWPCGLLLASQMPERH